MLLHYTLYLESTDHMGTLGSKVIYTLVNIIPSLCMLFTVFHADFDCQLQNTFLCEAIKNNICCCGPEFSSKSEPV